MATCLQLTTAMPGVAPARKRGALGILNEKLLQRVKGVKIANSREEKSSKGRCWMVEARVTYLSVVVVLRGDCEHMKLEITSGDESSHVKQ